MTKLTYEEYKKACDAGMHRGAACSCLGPQDGNEYCPCSMSTLNMLTDDGQTKLKEIWRNDGYLPLSEKMAIWEEEQKDDLEKSPYRKKRMELMKQKGYTT